ncbi:hypothetical protein EDD75_0007 [Thermodesulfitimonas autotrophica]|uniref:Uncharacterized protein n=1 Tax=Thermodesulfitimonas autotrophica TaxID=1894989 RepID=A0A3N5AWE4_9THEO|nr:hypothetical protein [Thermodesulfitimonas autotrophica]RPF49203.1 hypothetical protein EDD75_0007 [Thermodesulfitimonas autotrophica]
MAAKKPKEAVKISIRVSCGGGDGLKDALRLLAKKVLEKKGVREERCAQRSTSE